jgi:hypothetical protein
MHIAVAQNIGLRRCTVQSDTTCFKDLQSKLVGVRSADATISEQSPSVGGPI